MNETISIRPVEENEFNDFVEFQTEALFNTPEIYGSDYESYRALSILNKEQLFERILNYPFDFVLGAFTEQDAMVGMAGFSIQTNLPKQRHKGYIWSVYVSTNYRGKGLATNLIEDVLEIAKEDAGCEQVLVRVASSNLDGQALYRKLGFIQYGAEVRALKLGPDNYIDELLMIRLL